MYSLTDITMQLKHICASETLTVPCPPMTSGLVGIDFIMWGSRQLQINREKKIFFCPVNHISQSIMPLFFSSTTFLVQFQFNPASA